MLVGYVTICNRKCCYLPLNTTLRGCPKYVFKIRDTPPPQTYILLQIFFYIYIYIKQFYRNTKKVFVSFIFTKPQNCTLVIFIRKEKKQIGDTCYSLENYAI